MTTTGHPAAPPTLEDVARVAGVSRATVSRAVRGGERVSEAARAAVEAAIRELDYVPNRAARQLASRRAGTIAVVLPEPDTRVFADPFFALTMAGVNDALRDTDVQPVLLMGGPDGGTGRILSYLRGGHVDGVLVASHHRRDHLVEELAGGRLPAVFVGRPLRRHHHAYVVDVDNREGGRRAAAHLAERGCTRVVSIDGPPDMAASVDRAAGWRAGLEAAGLGQLGSSAGDFTARSGREAMRRLLREHPGLDGVFAASDLMAVAALDELRSAGIDVPGRVKVVGYDNHAFAEDASPPLTSVVNPARELAARAAHVLLELAEGGSPERLTLLPCTLVERESSAR
ncbi:LacI family DNA-binding transcriptional regulator [Zafaria sp. Z1313]|uniref:LacI family DNA-binding transcriptional regulator n=1 Tax=unclassified Zafaria TaxID=2828765 RepID=UPI002E798307|nr:LacI family DNA-binding transcriptional regulator [Zafaria sp. J156]MEE1622323.1 LacI family DNA-binding transcriptional regulator [Zafaria sp. J156]